MYITLLVRVLPPLKTTEDVISAEKNQSTNILSMYASSLFIYLSSSYVYYSLYERAAPSRDY